MSAHHRRGWSIPASIVAFLFLAASAAGGAAVCTAAQMVPGPSSPRPTGNDSPLARFASFSTDPCASDQYNVVWNGKGMHDAGGRVSFRLNIPGTPVAAYLYLVGTDVAEQPAPHFPDGDQDVRVVVTPETSPQATYTTVPVAYKAFNAFVNKLDITADVSAGLNTIRIRGYDLNDPEGAFAVAVYSAPGLAPVQVDLFDGADAGWFPWPPPFGPDSEVVASTFASLGTARQGRVMLALGGNEPGRGEEIFAYTGTGDPALAIPDRDGDGLPDILRRQFRLTRVDGPPLRNDPADAAGHREALRGAQSLEEDDLGVPRSQGGSGRGPQLDLFAKRYRIPAGAEYAAFQVQSEDPESGDSFTLAFAANKIPLECNINPIPNITVTKAPKYTEGAPGLVVDFTFEVTAEGGTEPLRDVTVVDDPPMAISGPTGDDGDGLLSPGEVWVYAASATFNVPGSYPDTVTASGFGDVTGLPVSATDDALVVVTQPPGPAFHIVKTAAPVLVKAGETVTYTYTVCNDGDVTLDGVVVTDDRFPGEAIGVVDDLVPGECDGSVTKLVSAPPCDRPDIGLLPGVCQGETARGTCFWPNIGTATWTDLHDDDDACITIQEPGFHIVKTADPVLVDAGEPVTYTYTVCNDGDYTLDGIVVTDDRFPGETIGVVNDLVPGECDGSVTKTVNAPACEEPGIGLEEGVCDGETRWGTCFWPNVGTATWEQRTDEDDECITIREYGTIVVAKVTEGGQGDFGFTSDFAGAFTLAGGDSRTTTRLRAGTYSVAEDTPLPPDWTLVSATCDDGSPVGAISLQANETVTCTFVNRYETTPPGTIIVEKHTVGGDASFTFTSATLPSPFELATVGGSASRTFGGLDPGTYDVAEEGEYGWTLDSAACTSSLGGSEDPAAIGLEAGETVTCVFTNSVCGPCVGKVSLLRLKFLGSSSSLIHVTVRGDKFPNDVVYDGWVDPAEIFELTPNDSPEPGFEGTLGTEVKVYVNDVLNTTIHTSCSQPIGPGQVWGSFEVIYGESKIGGALCPLEL